MCSSGVTVSSVGVGVCMCVCVCVCVCVSVCNNSDFGHSSLCAWNDDRDEPGGVSIFLP